jgi:hypothetical protein
MGRVVLLLVVAVLLAGLGLDAAQQRRSTAKPTARRTTTTAVCAADLGTGVKTSRRFCDIIIASTPSASVSMTIPARTGAATLLFDLHNRFMVPAPVTPPALAFMSHVALVSVIRQTGEVIDRAAVSREFRTAADLFDRISGGTPGGAPKAIAPGQPQAIRVTIPSGVNTIGIVGARLEEWRASGRGAFDTPDRPIAIVSNLRIEYTPR